MLHVMVMRGLAAVAGLVVFTTGCASHPPRTVALSTEPATAVTLIRDAHGAARTAARIEQPDVLVLQFYGSTTCPGVVAAISKLSAHKVDVTIWQDYESCTADAKPYLSRIRLPHGVGTAAPIEVHVKYRSGSETLTTGG